MAMYRFINLEDNKEYIVKGDDFFGCLMEAMKIQPERMKRKYLEFNHLSQRV